MQAADGGAETSPDVRYAPDIPKMTEPLALPGIPRNDHDLVDRLLQGVDEAVDEGLAPEREEVLLPPPGTACRSADKDNRRSHALLSRPSEPLPEADQFSDAGVVRRPDAVPFGECRHRTVHEVDLGLPPASDILEHR